MKIEKVINYRYYNNKATVCDLKLYVFLSSDVDCDSPIEIHSEGRTVLRDGDTYDQKLGERIAESKALIKAYKGLSAYLGTDCKFLAESLALLDNDLRNIQFNLEKEINHKDFLINSTK